MNEPVLQQRTSTGRSCDDRRMSCRAENDGLVAKRLEAGRRFASAFQAVCLIGVGACVAVFLAFAMYHALARPFAKVGVALGGSAD